MIKGIYNSAAGMLTRMVQQDVIANNLANAATPGYKKDGVFLNTMLEASLVLQKDVNQNPLILDAQRVETDMSQGGLRATGNPFDLALQGPGYFAVETPSGTMYTRAGSMTLNAEGELVTLTGHRVLGEGGAIELPPGEFAVSNQGAISVDGVEVNRLKIVNFSDPNALIKKADGLFAARPGATETESPETTVSQGFVEDSNVSAIREMVEMINMQQAYQASARALMAQDETLDKTVNQVGAVR
jgi:flagellar basal-body rod protein FlgF